MAESLSELDEKPRLKRISKQGIYFKTQSFLASESQGSDLITDGLHQRENRSQHPWVRAKSRLPSSGERKGLLNFPTTFPVQIFFESLICIALDF